MRRLGYFLRHFGFAFVPVGTVVEVGVFLHLDIRGAENQKIFCVI